MERWISQLSKTERDILDKLDAEIAVLRNKRYKIQNAATKRAEREGVKAKKTRRKTKQAKGVAKRARTGERPDRGGDSSRDVATDTGI
jgi:hypothetical protein